MPVVIYFTSVSGCNQTKKNQTSIFQHLDSKNIPYKTVDISQSADLRTEMRDKMGNPKALPPQIFNDDTYCGDYSMFFEAVEAENVKEFLKLK
ncbi:SH3 domain-binding glutamic acid-rich-like protein 3 [Anguilla rostrata]|uniref:SH3 domain-binding glutamic acid-rich-like protein 3 n=1 Tax=Anguilla rostrata TaxID=7938 RepID=UPI0030CB6EB1